MADQYAIDERRAEIEQIDRMLADPGEQERRPPTPVPWWSVADQIAYLAFMFA